MCIRRFYYYKLGRCHIRFCNSIYKWQSEYYSDRKKSKSDVIAQHLKDATHGGGSSITKTGDTTKFCITDGSSLKICAECNIEFNPSKKDFVKKRVTFKSAFTINLTVVATINLSREKNVTGTSSVYVTNISTTGCDLIYDSIDTSLICNVSYIAIGW